MAPEAIDSVNRTIRCTVAGAGGAGVAGGLAEPVACGSLTGPSSGRRSGSGGAFAAATHASGLAAPEERSAVRPAEDPARYRDADRESTTLYADQRLIGFIALRVIGADTLAAGVIRHNSGCRNEPNG